MWALVTIVTLSSCFALYHCITIYKYFTQLHYYTKTTKQKSGSSKLDTHVKILQVLSTTSVVCFTILLLHFFILLSLGVDSFSFESNKNLNLNSTSKKLLFIIILVIVIIVGVAGFTAIRLFHVWRLKMSFDHSLYQPSNKLLFFLIVVISWSFFQLCGALIYGFAKGVGNPFDEIDPKHHEYRQTVEIASVVFGIAAFIQILVDLFVCLIFNKNLLSLTVMQRKSIVDMKNVNNNTGNNNINDKNINRLIQVSDVSGDSTPVNVAIASDTSTIASNNNDTDAARSDSKSSLSVQVVNAIGDIGDKIHVNVQQIQSVELSDNQQELLQATTKQTVLTLWSTVIGIIASFAILSQIGLRYYLFLYIAMCSVITATVWLSFAFADKEYKKQCKNCNDCFFVLCQTFASYKISRMEQKQMQAIRSIELQSAAK